MRAIMITRAIATTAFALALGLTVSAQRVDNAEYFWDADPGVGNGIAMSALDGAFDAAVEGVFLNTASLPGLGAHTLGIRVKDLNNNWGPVFRTTIVVEPSVVTAPEIHVGQAEFFWDNDPGEGNGTPMLAFDGNYNDALESIRLETASLPADGVHVLNVRALDANMVWSAPFRVVVEVLGGTVTFPEIHVSAAEYYVNIDPGMGNAMPMLAVDGSFDSALEAIRGGGVPAPVDAGVNVLWMRARDVHNAWGPSFGIVVNIDTTIAGTVGLPDMASPLSWEIRPNPADAMSGLTITLGDGVGRTRVQLVDAQGRTVLDQSQPAGRRIEVPLHGISPGVYHVGVSADGMSGWKKVLVH